MLVFRILQRFPPLLVGLATLALATGAARAASPATLDDGRWISVSGEVQSASDDAFVLRHRTGSITVELDDWDWYSEARPIRPGQHVTVNGRIDKNLFERRTLEARSVYVDEHKTFYYGSPVNEEQRQLPQGGFQWGFTEAGIPPGMVLLSGTVKSIRGREMVLDTGPREVTVDIEKIGYNPFDDRGVQRISAGDRVRVSGYLDEDLFERREIDATNVFSVRDR